MNDVFFRSVVVSAASWELFRRAAIRETPADFYPTCKARMYVEKEGVCMLKIAHAE
jgi:hypothetical protein